MTCFFTTTDHQMCSNLSINNSHSSSPLTRYPTWEHAQLTWWLICYNVRLYYPSFGPRCRLSQCDIRWTMTNYTVNWCKCNVISSLIDLCLFFSLGKRSHFGESHFNSCAVASVHNHSLAYYSLFSSLRAFNKVTKASVVTFFLSGTHVFHCIEHLE